ncbi:ribonuclease H-like domain-containing protein [Tanacetum coccineum]|uniref:ATP-dependent DNA helicase n=1 Tax=Tanacetum coccineum TaxID=301880 RepID=A0ABQ5IZ48_9ASTR
MATCNVYHLFGDDTEWIDTIHGGSQWQRGLQLIDLFVSILLFYDVADIGQFFRSSLPYLALIVVHAQHYRKEVNRFRISIDLDKDSCCAIDVTSDLAELIKDHVRGGHNKVFGGKVVVLGGDFRQIHPVISNGTRFDIVTSVVNKSDKKPIPTIYARTTTNPDGYMLNLTIPGPVTTEEKVQKKNDVKAKISTGSTLDNTANLSDAIIYASYPNNHYGSLHLFRKDPITIHEDDLEEMDLKWQLALLSMRARRYYQRTRKKITINGSDTAGYDKSKVEYFNCHKMRHFARECRGPRNQESKARFQDSSIRTVNVEEIASKIMVAIDGAGLFVPYLLKFPTLGLRIFQEPEFEGFLNLEDNKSVCKNSANEIKKTTDALIIEDWVSDCDEDDSEVMVLKSDNVQHKPEQANQPKKVTVLTKSGIVPVSAARPINTVAPKSFVNVAKTRPNAFQINTAKINSVNTAKGNRVTSAVGEQGINAIKSSAC